MADIGRNIKTANELTVGDRIYVHGQNGGWQNVVLVDAAEAKGGIIVITDGDNQVVFTLNKIVEVR